MSRHRRRYHARNARRYRKEAARIAGNWRRSMLRGGALSAKTRVHGRPSGAVTHLRGEITMPGKIELIPVRFYVGTKDDPNAANV